MNTLKGNEEAVRRGSFGAALGVGELSERYVMDLSSLQEKQKERRYQRQLLPGLLSCPSPCIFIT